MKNKKEFAKTLFPKFDLIANLTANPTFAIRGILTSEVLINQRKHLKSLHYKLQSHYFETVSSLDVIFGGGCFGKLNFIWFSSILCSFSGCVYRINTSCFPSVVGRCTSSICIFLNFSITALGVSPGANHFNLCLSVTFKQ